MKAGIAIAKHAPKLESIEFLRGTAALAVVFFHLTRRQEFSTGSWIKEVGNYGYLGVYAFFVISGIVIPFALESDQIRGGGALLFLRKRLVRLYPPFFFSLLLCTGILWVESISRSGLSPEVGANLTWRTFLSNAFLISDISGAGWINSIYWTLAIEFQFYLLMAFGFYYFRKLRTWLQIITLLALSTAALPFYQPGIVVTYLPLFATGITTWLYVTGRIGPFVATTAIVGQGIIVYLHLGLPVALTLLGSVAFSLAFIGYRFGRLLFIGNIAYSLYLLHIPIGSRIINEGLSWSRQEIGLQALLVGAVSGSILISWIFHLGIERPFLNFSRALASRSAPKREVLKSRSTGSLRDHLCLLLKKIDKM